MKKVLSLPLIAFLFVFLAHAAWAIARAPAACTGELDPCQETLSALVHERAATYLSAQDYLLSFSFALLAAFTTSALLKLVDNRRRAIAASGGLLLIGGIYAAGCFAIGCCGSPMLAVYLGFLGPRLAGFGKPLLAAFTVVSVAAGWWWLRRCCLKDPSCCPPDK